MKNFIKYYVRILSKWAWESEFKELKDLNEERDIMLEGLEKCGWPCRLVELQKYYLELVHAYSSLVNNPPKNF